MVPRGEVGLVFALAGLNQGIFDASMYASVIFVVAVTTLLAPFLIKAAAKRQE
jgi:Kef-type K+ transport system membrane component KefB